MSSLSRARSRTPLLLSLSGLMLLPGASLAASPGPDAVPTDCKPGELGQVDHPTGCTDVVLRMSVGGGFVPMEVALTEMPTFTLYGDNTVIFRPQPADGMFPMPGEPGIPLVRAVMTPAQVDALLAFALRNGGLADAQEQYINPLIADAPTTTFTIDAAGITRQVSIQALGFDDPGAPDAPDAAARARFADLADLLDSFEEQVAAGNVESASRYEPARYRGIITEVWEGVQNPVVEWPWTDLAPSDFKGPVDGVARYAEVTPTQLAEVTPVPSGGITTIRMAASDGSEWFFSARPLLPDEDVMPDGIA